MTTSPHRLGDEGEPGQLASRESWEQTEPPCLRTLANEAVGGPRCVSPGPGQEALQHRQAVTTDFRRGCGSWSTQGQGPKMGWWRVSGAFLGLVGLSITIASPLYFSTSSFPL